MAAPVYLSHPSSLEHDTGHHPECAARIVAIEGALRERDWLGLERVESRAADVALITAVHDARYVDAILRASAEGGGMLDADTVISDGSWRAALHAAGGACELVDLLLGGEAPTGMSAHRPPGHHAEHAQAMGFCLFNNVAVAAQHALDAGGLERVLVLDFDVHHGNGTNDLFHDTPSVLYASIHQSPLYPGTGAATDIGVGRGEGFTVNLPVGPGSGDAVFVSLVAHVVCPIARAYAPQLILLSAGYDAHRDDPLADCRVTEAGYAAMTAAMLRVGAELEAPVGAVLEGGYELGALARSVVATLEVLGAGAAPAPTEVALDPVAAAARERLGERWSLSGAV